MVEAGADAGSAIGFDGFINSLAVERADALLLLCRIGRYDTVLERHGMGINSAAECFAWRLDSVCTPVGELWWLWMRSLSLSNAGASTW